MLQDGGAWVGLFLPLVKTKLGDQSPPKCCQAMAPLIMLTLTNSGLADCTTPASSTKNGLPVQTSEIGKKPNTQLSKMNKNRKKRPPRRFVPPPDFASTASNTYLCIWSFSEIPSISRENGEFARCRWRQPSRTEHQRLDRRGSSHKTQVCKLTP